MPREPRWWYSAEVGTVARLLSPAAAVYGWVAERRYRRGRPFRSGLPVICVGNFSAGGTGKTPLALLIGRKLAGAGESPVFLTRGYGGREAGPRIVVPSVDTAEEVGDEALLLAREARTIVARDRAAGARAAERLTPAPTVIVMDDGLQNPGLAKDLVIAVIDGARRLGNGRVIPAGPLRAPLAFQLALADAILINAPVPREGAVLAAHLREWFSGPILVARAEPEGNTSWLAGAPVTAFAGIGHPERFFAMLDRLGARTLDRIVFADHHPYSDRDAEALLAAAAAHGSVLVTTEKDLVRLSGLGGSCARLRESARGIGLHLALDSDGPHLMSLLQSALKRTGHTHAVS